MNIQEIRKERLDLKEKIEAIIQDFESRTKAEVLDINVNRVDVSTFNHNQTVCHSVSVKIAFVFDGAELEFRS